MAKKSKRREMAEEGVLHQQYTQNGYFVKFKAAYQIEKVCVSFVKKGSKGDGFDIYIDMDLFDNWCDDILNRQFAATIKAEKAAGKQYPETYKYVTGENGEKSVGFAPSSGAAFCVINGVTVKDKKKEYANVPVDLYWMKTLAKYFKRTSAIRFEELAKITLAGSTKYRDEKAEAAALQEAAKVAQETKSTESVKMTEAKKKTEKPEKNGAATATAKTNGEITVTENGDLSFLVNFKKDGEFGDQVYKVFMSNQKVNEIGKDKIKTLIEKAKTKPVVFIMTCHKDKDIFVFDGFSA